MNTEEIPYETPLTERLFQKACDNKSPISGTFELTPMCNLNCKMCYIRQSAEDIKQSGKRLRTLEEWKRLADEAVKQGLLYLLLTGGEPLSWPYFWELYEYLGKKGVIISINTNGSLIDAKTIEYLKKQPPARINITLYGASEETYRKLCRQNGVYSKVIKAIEMLQDAGILVKLNCSLTPDNAADLQKIVDYAKARNLILQVNTYMFPPVRKNISDKNYYRFKAEEAACWHLKRYHLQHTEERYREFLKSLQDDIFVMPHADENDAESDVGKMQCRAGKAMFWASWDGALLPCGMMPYPRVELKKENFSEAWEKLTVKTEQIRLPGICEKCEGKKICHSCAAMSVAETGEYQKVPVYLCEMVNSMKKIASDQLRIYGIEK